MSCSSDDRLREIENWTEWHAHYPELRYFDELIAMVREKQKIIAEEKEIIRELERKLIEASIPGVKF